MIPFLYKPAISQESADWIVSCYEWAVAHFDMASFHSKSQLVSPSPEFFPKKVNNPEEMANYMFERVVELSGLQHWPFRLGNVLQDGVPSAPEPLGLEYNRRYLPVIDSGVGSELNASVLQVAYMPEQLKKPQDLSASFAHSVAQHLVFQSGIEPPGGREFFAQSTEVLASFLGFGLLLANSAYTFRGGCGSCYNAAANRTAAFSEAETVFSMALYCKLKNIPNQEVFKYLKKHLRSTYKNSLKQIDKGQYSLLKQNKTEAENWAQVTK